ncbi:MAG TPA: diguanylate cyclase [Nitrosospira sp.]|nr:diguanylate cyclase [Nitrosospira sp.]
MVKKETVHIFLLLIFILTPVASLAAQDYAAWSKKNPDGSWTRTAEIAVAASSLPSLEPKDIGKFCPTYKRLPPKKRIKFWVGLLSAMARPESSFNPGATHKELFKEKSGKQGISRGLLQISIESANQPGYRCGIKKAKDLHNPAIHLPCAVKILSTWVAADHVIATYKGDKKNRGGGRYWAVLREKNGPLSEISNFTKNLSFCRHPTGDEILQEAARRMSGVLRGYDRIGRYGGEEFLITASVVTGARPWLWAKGSVVLSAESLSTVAQDKLS